MSHDGSANGSARTDMNDNKKNVKEELNELADEVAKAVPHKERVKSTHKGFGTVTDPKVGAATAIKPGEVRNPGGRPKNTPMTDALRKRLMSRLPLKYAKELGIPQNATWADAIAWSCLHDLIKNPDPDKFEAYATRTDGPLVQETSGPQGPPIPFDLV